MTDDTCQICGQEVDPCRPREHRQEQGRFTKQVREAYDGGPLELTVPATFVRKHGIDSDDELCLALLDIRSEG